MAQKLRDMAKHVKGLFPTDKGDNTRFAINFYTSIGLGTLTEDLREFLDKQPELELQARY